MKLTALLPVLCMTPLLAHAGTYYDITFLDLGRVTDVEHITMNNSGNMAGRVSSSKGNHAFSSSGSFATPAPFDLRGSNRLRINDSGTLAGTTFTGNRVVAATHYNGQTTALGDLGYVSNYYGSEAYGINNRGDVVGYVTTDGGPNQSYLNQTPALFSQGKITPMGSLGGSWGSAIAINDNGTAIGNAYIAGDWYQHAFKYENGVMQDLGTFGGNESFAYDINAAGDIIGRAERADGSWASFIYSNGVMQELAIGGWAINDAGHILGNKYNAAESRFEPAVHINGTAVSLQDAIGTKSWYVKAAYDINNADQIAAQLCNDTSGCQLALLSPVPEPTTYTMLLGGLGVVGLAARRRVRIASKEKNQ